jgi:hypothetical protein
LPSITPTPEKINLWLGGGRSKSSRGPDAARGPPVGHRWFRPFVVSFQAYLAPHISSPHIFFVLPSSFSVIFHLLYHYRGQAGSCRGNDLGSYFGGTCSNFGWTPLYCWRRFRGFPLPSGKCLGSTQVRSLSLMQNLFQFICHPIVQRYKACVIDSVAKQPIKRNSSLPLCFADIEMKSHE